MKTTISEGFLKGYKRALCMGGTKEWPNIYNDREKDFYALRRDWENVGEYVRGETAKFKRM